MSNFKRTTVELDEEKLEKFRLHFPQHGALKWALDSYLEEVCKILDSGEHIKLIDSSIAAASLKSISRMGEGGSET